MDAVDERFFRAHHSSQRNVAAHLLRSNSAYGGGWLHRHFSLPELARADTVVLEYAMQHLPVVLVGLLGAGTLAASMSSSEPFIHSVSLSFSKDVLQPVLKLSDAATGKAGAAVNPAHHVPYNWRRWRSRSPVAW